MQASYEACFRREKGRIEMNKAKVSPILGVILSAPLLLSGCGAAASYTANQAAKVVTIREVGSDFKFSIPNITVYQGQEIRITFVNKGEAEHNWTLDQDGYNAQTYTIQPGQTASTEFVASYSGTFSFLCSVPGHAEAGMQGTLTVLA